MSVSVTGTGVAPVPFAGDLQRHDRRVALVLPEEQVTYGDLADRVAETARWLGSDRRLVMLEGANELDAVVMYLAALATGHPLLLAPAGTGPLAAAYDPDVVVGRDTGGWRFHERRTGSAHDLHPDLALLLTTSGSTGSAKVVRLSHRNLQSNAEAIAAYLDIRPDDRAVTSLPMHYCYGLSVINSYLLRGASVVLTPRSVTEPAFWDMFRETGATSFAGVPYTFELLDRVGFDRMRLPRLRYVTQAGGRLAPDTVRRYAGLGRRDGWDLVIMYGQTEATARMAYLPAHLAVSHPGSIGFPIPGGRFRLVPVPGRPEPDCGELVYEGPNVMLGYAETAADLSAGRTVTQLYTGDIARRTGDGLYEIVGRRSRFAKVFGLRIDLSQVEAALEARGFVASCADGDGELVVVLETGGPGAGGAGTGGPGTGPAGVVETVRRVAARSCRLPAGAVRVRQVAALPRLPNGKPDHRALAGIATGAEPATPADVPVAVAPPPPAGREEVDRGTGQDDLRRLFADVLGVDEVTGEDSFASLGGDSLSYVEMSVRLERVLGHLPEQWHETPIRELRRVGPGRSGRAGWRGGAARVGRVAAVDTSVALRAAAIVMIVGTHSALFPLAGGAHLLLAVAGYNVARLHLTAANRTRRVRHAARGALRIAVASMTWIALAYLVTDYYSVANVFLVNYLVGSDDGRQWHFWFIETLVYIQLAVVAMMAVPAMDRWDRRFPFGFPLLLAALALVTRYELVPGAPPVTPLVVFWLFALGWAAARATTGWQRAVVTAAALATVPGFFGNPYRDAIVIAGLAVLIWVTRVPSLGPVNRVVGLLAHSSLYIYLTHWLVYPRLYQDSPLLAVVASLAVGIAYAWLAGRVGRFVMSAWRRLTRPARVGDLPQ